MSDSLITIVAIFLAAILMFIFPLISMSERTDDVSQLAAQQATTEFVNKVETTGRITLEDYDQYISTLSATGNTYDIEMKIQYLDENPGVKVSQAQGTKIGENLQYTINTTQIAKLLEDNKRIPLTVGDMFSVSAKKTNKSVAEMFFYVINGNQTVARDSCTASVNGQ